ncbi:uncharacterized protein [Lolium perenne]|jgi:hypothetical protein|uniref:uncharacterized protein n=1 Tax=Lolium perenne TaxID=4522 RepID=UPI0021F63D84|nr:uncharacterized protein LOC127301448 [Lolium perenne]
MSRRFLPPIVPLVLLLLASTSPPATAAAEAILQLQVAEAPSAAGCSRSAAAAAQVVVESCTEDIVRSFFGVRGSDVCCRALEGVGAGCYRAVFSGSPFVDIYATILGNVCGLAAAPAPSPGAMRMTE